MSGTPEPELAARIVLNRASRTVDELYRTADKLCCLHPETAEHVRQLAQAVARDVLDSLRRWPTSDANGR